MTVTRALAVDKDKFDAVLRALINAPPTTFKEVAAKPKPRRDGGVKRSAKKMAAKSAPRPRA
jgi:hypothetical protein